ncbi:dicarboxylate/amino acid:cation symporter [Senegalia sp. (in: firmicutes)]|uniref:dicarboxylate/amino acid:cation symporter n=1 Tax=Senegalia sp. (in: firmicutes) TaxID=1924098 RepID=UPI003F9475BA
MNKIGLTTKILIGLILGIVTGILVKDIPQIINAIEPLGEIFIRLIKMIIVPLVFSTIIIGISSVSDIKKLGRMGGKTILYFLFTTSIAVVIGITLSNIIQPGEGIDIALNSNYEFQTPPSPLDTLLNIIPANPINALSQGELLQVIFFAIFIGIGSTLVGIKSKPVINFFDSLAEIMYKITEIIMKISPIGVFGLIVPVVARNGIDILLPLVKVIFAMYIGVIIHALLVYASSVKLFTGISILKFFKSIFPAQMIAFSSCSSSGTLPISMKCAQENLGISKEVSSFVLSLGATINMDGNSLYQGVSALFIAQAYGLELTLLQQLMIVLTGTLASIGAAGVPGAGLIVLSMVLSSVGLPIEGIGIVAGIDRILDMARTMLNVTGDISASLIVASTEGEIDQKLLKL